MGEKIDDLAKAVSHTVRYISKLKEERIPASATPPPAEKSDSSAARDSRIRELTEENARLLKERKEARRRIRSVIREIDKVK